MVKLLHFKLKLIEILPLVYANELYKIFLFFSMKFVIVMIYNRICK